MSLEKTTGPEIDTHEEGESIQKGRIRELVESGKSPTDALEEVLGEISGEKEEDDKEEEMEAKVSSIKEEIDQTLDSRGSQKDADHHVGPLIGAMIIGGSDKGEAEQDKKQEDQPGYKIEGETLVFKGRAYRIEGKTGDGYTARPLVLDAADMQSEKKDGRVTIPAEMVTDKVEARLSVMNNAYAERFGFKPADLEALEKNPEYQKLSIGERRFVLESFTAATLEKVDEAADQKYEQGKGGKNWFRQIEHSFKKETRLSVARKESFEELRNGGYRKHKETLEAIISRTGAMGVPMLENEKGELEVQYSAHVSGLMNSSPAAQKAMRNFDQAATELQSIPPEWDNPMASIKQKMKAKAARAEYDATRNAYFNHLSDQGNTEAKDVLSLEGTMIDAKINLNRMMNAHPANERVIKSLNNAMGDQVLKGNLTDVFTKDYKLGYMAGGMGSRAAAKYWGFLGAGLEGAYASTIAISGIVGGVRGWNMSRKMIREDEKALRRGAKEIKIGKKENADKKSDMLKIDNLEEKEGAPVVHRGFVNKIDFLVSKIEEADAAKDMKNADMYRNMLQNRVGYAMDRAKKGKVTFGDESVRIGNQVAFTSAINKGLAYIKAADPAENLKFKARMNQVLKIESKDKARLSEQRDFITAYTIRNAAAGALMGGIGFRLMDWWQHGGGHGGAGAPANHEHIGGREYVRREPGIPLHPEEPNADLTAVRDNTRVAMPIPPEDMELSGGKDINDYFNKPHTMDPLSPYPRPDHGDPFEYINDRADNVTTPGSRSIEGIPDNAYIGKGEGIEHALRRQIESDPDLAKELGFKGDIHDKAALHKFSGNAAHKLAIQENIVDPATGKEIHVRWAGEKSASAVITHGPDGKIDVQVKGPTYNDNMPGTGRGNNVYHPNQDDYIYKEGVKTGVINYPPLETPDPTTTYNQAANPHDLQQEAAQSVGKKLDANDVAANKKTPTYRPRITSAGQYPTTAPTNIGGYPTTNTGNSWNGWNPVQDSQQWNTNPGAGYYVNDIRIGQDGIPYTPSGTVAKEMTTNGKVWYMDTHSFDPDHAFDPKVNRQYDRLIGDLFGHRDNMTGDIVIDKEMSNMLTKHNAAYDIKQITDVGGDISEIPDAIKNDQSREYFELLKQMHESSGLEPKDGIPTATYMKQALQHMKDDGNNIRRFVSNVLDAEEAKKEALDPGSVPKVRNSDYQNVDDVYR